MKWKTVKWSRLTERLGGKPGFVLLLLPCALLLSLYINVKSDVEYGDLQYPSFKTYNDGAVEGYLIWNPKCHLLAKSPRDPSIVKFVKKEAFEPCAAGPPLSRLSRDANGTVILVLDGKLASSHRELRCCWSPVLRPQPLKNPGEKFDSTIVTKECQKLEGQVAVPAEIEVAFVRCQAKGKSAGAGGGRAGRGGSARRTVYENVHAVLHLDKVRDRLGNESRPENGSRKLSVLLLGIDSVSRLNFRRAMPKTEKYLRETGWISLDGYNKMGENTFPNLMAILTGQNQQEAYSRCKPSEPFRLDRCPFIWRNFRNAGYVTAYGEDDVALSTFNYLKVGFVEPPTDYYLRPYVLACEKLLKSKKRFSSKYCTGPELTFDRIFDYATNFARTFLGTPYFGFFWTNSVSHDNMNGPSSVDKRMLDKLELLESSGVLNDTMIVFLSDHGMRYGGIRETFVGWYEERLPFLYVWLPEWFRSENPAAHRALRTNGNRLTSPYDLHETLRGISIGAGSAIQSNVTQGCDTCQTLFTVIPAVRGCRDAGIAAHWCTCTGFSPEEPSDPIVQEGARRFLEHIENIVKVYKDSKGKRLCAKLKLNRIHRVSRVLDFDEPNETARNIVAQYFYMLQVSPGYGKFEVTVQYHSNGNYTISDHQIGRINSYATEAKCLDHGSKQYCYCVK